MERASRYNKSQRLPVVAPGYIFFGALTFFAALILMPIADAGTVFQAMDGGMVSEPQATNGPIEHFPESRFASAEAKDMDTPDEQGGSRSPASMDFGGGDVSHQSPRAEPPLRNLAPSNVAGTPGALADTVFGGSGADELSGAINRSGVQEVAVIASDLGFFPRTLFVARDVPVRIFVTGASKNTLCIMMDSFQVRKQVRAQKIEEITFTPATPGKYRFYCPVNGMEGTLVVKEFSSTSHVSRTTASNSDGSPR